MFIYKLDHKYPCMGIHTHINSIKHIHPSLGLRLRWDPWECMELHWPIPCRPVRWFGGPGVTS